MRQRSDDIGATIVNGAALWRRLKRAFCKEQQLPAGLQEPPGKREADIVRTVLSMHRGQREEVGFYRQRIAVSDPGKARIRECREVICPVGPHALAQRPQELRICPAADSGFGVGRNVRAVERPERCRQSPASGEWLTAGGSMA
jgi:hypothetical protein